MKNLIFSSILLLAFAACQNSEQAHLHSDNSVLSELPTPCKEGGESNLFVSQSGQTYLSWIEYLNDSTDALMMSALKEGKWLPAKEIAQSTNWFVNWADFPSITAYKNDDKSLAVHWLEKSAEGTYDYDIHISQSLDGGQNWSKSFILHRDSIPAEHGFVSMVPLANDRIFAAWLDGRNTKVEKEGAPRGAMTLRSASFDRTGKLFDEAELDYRICDCCQTDVALTNNGPVVVYRDRSEEEIRDVYIVRQVNGEWTEPKVVYPDNWKINGCPVNGPAIAAQENEVAVVWYGMVEGKAEVKVAFSSDGGASFKKPVKIDDGNPSGRVSVLWYNKDVAAVTWLENKEKDALIQMALVDKNGIIKDKRSLVATSSSRSSGFPKLEKINNQLIMAWTNISDGHSSVRAAFINL